MGQVFGQVSCFAFGIWDLDVAVHFRCEDVLLAFHLIDGLDVWVS